MKTPIKLLKSLPRSRKLILAASTGLVVLSTSSVLAFNGLTSTGAEETPLRPQVDDHEKRITKNEQDIAETKDRVGKVEEKSDSNEQRVGAVERDVVVVKEKQAATAGQVQQLQQSAPAPAPAAQPAPQAAPAPAPVNRRQIIAVTATPLADKYGVQWGWQCNYELPQGRMIASMQSAPCEGVGAEIPEDLALTNGVVR